MVPAATLTPLDALPDDRLADALRFLRYLRNCNPLWLRFRCRQHRAVVDLLNAHCVDVEIDPSGGGFSVFITTVGG